MSKTSENSSDPNTSPAVTTPELAWDGLTIDLIGTETRDMAQEPPAPPSSPPPDDIEGEVVTANDDHWKSIVTELSKTESCCETGREILNSIGENSLNQNKIDKWVEKIENKIVSTQPERKTIDNPIKKNNNKLNRSERTIQKIDRYARTQELFKRNPFR